MLGYSPDEFLELSVRTYSHPDDIQRNDELFAEMFAGVRDHFELDKRFFHKDGHIVWGRLQVSALREGDDEPMFAMAERVTGCLRPGDTAARLGGDEFAVPLEQGTVGRPVDLVVGRSADSDEDDACEASA
ncbi:MAG: PAS domain S-box protein [Nitriliruptor sp.]|nr:MAG: PAS domain S-box protein [Nitriliruptor sp.]